MEERLKTRHPYWYQYWNGTQINLWECIAPSVVLNILLDDDVDAMRSVLRDPGFRMRGRWTTECGSIEMCKLLLVRNCTFKLKDMRQPITITTLVQNGYVLPVDDYFDRFEQTRYSFVALRKRIVILLGIKSKRKRMVMIDRFVVREIAISMWAQRETFYEQKPVVKEEENHEAVVIMDIILILGIGFMYYHSYV